MNKVRFETLEKLFQYFDDMFMQTDNKNFYLFNRVVVFKIPKIYMELEMYKYTDEEKINVENDYKKSINCKRLFENTDLYVESYVTLAGTFCRNIDSFKNVVNALYYLFYSQRESLSALINLDDFECMEQIRVLKTQGYNLEKAKEI